MTTSSSAARRTRRALTGLGIVAVSMVAVAPVAGAERTGSAASARGGSPAADDHDRSDHAMCHRTGSAADPYARITVALRTVDGELVAGDGGHESHHGPVFDPATMDEDDTWGDIIPPFTTPDGVTHAGTNWPASRATFDNGCSPVGPAGPADPVEDGGGATPDGAEVPANRGDDVRGEERDREDEGVSRDGEKEGATERAVTGPRRPDALAGQPSAVARGSADAIEERILRTGEATGDIAAVLGQQVTRDPGRGAVVPAGDSESTLATGLAHTDSSLLVLLMLGLSVLIGGYVAVDALRERMRRTD